ncbi:hypothetical protein LTR37_014356 [Vermiconidia calcicola]|uniref:Uncharacterized protein n=1 Tax=Vermiconidia calcicola TaxID=1690605 RepID=A0ACC3MUJ5_9PEZI|nr:hypothetical protein LTR37_014356 [Vermiconidia calcicola]
MLGKKQVLRRQFKFSTMLGFASTVMVAWEFVLLVIPFTLKDGGTPGVFWGLLICPCVMTPVYASLAEVASMSPTAGGQYHWVSELAPPKFQKGLSYSVGWLIAMGWQTFLCGVSYCTAGLILGLAVLNSDGAYQIQSWHTTLLTIAIVTFCTLFNIFLTVRLPLTEAIVLILHIVGVFVVIIPLWVTAPRGNTYDTIFKWEDNAGWGNVRLASTIGIKPTAKSMAMLSSMRVLVDWSSPPSTSQHILNIISAIRTPMPSPATGMDSKHPLISSVCRINVRASL